eukprot:2213939-Prymnesium_polylepis.1
MRRRDAALPVCVKQFRLAGSRAVLARGWRVGALLARAVGGLARGWHAVGTRLARWRAVGTRWRVVGAP